MSRKRFILISLVMCGLGLVVVVVPLAIRLQFPNGPSDSRKTEMERKKLKNGLETLVGQLSKFSLKPVMGIEKKLDAAIATGDYGEMRRAFSDAVYGRFGSMEDSVGAMKKHLETEDVIVSFLAAEHLLIAGDRSGVPKLIELIKNTETIPYKIVTKEFELKDIACEILGKFRIEEAIPFLKDYYSRTGAGQAVGALTAMGQRAGSWQEKFNELESAGYAMVGATEYLPDIKKTFQESTNPEVRIGAAWAAAYMGGGPEYVNHLIEASKLAAEARDDRGTGEFNKSREALRYLGTLQTPEAVAALEKALDSKNPRASSVALVNLLFNQAEPSEKARQMLLDQLNGTVDHRVYPELAMRITAALDDAELKEAAARASRRTSAYHWRFWGVERANWPVENWIYDYIVIRNRTE